MTTAPLLFACASPMWAAITTSMLMLSMLVIGFAIGASGR